MVSSKHAVRAIAVLFALVAATVIVVSGGGDTEASGEDEIVTVSTTSTTTTTIVVDRPSHPLGEYQIEERSAKDDRVRFLVGIQKIEMDRKAEDARRAEAERRDAKVRAQQKEPSTHPVQAQPEQQVASPPPPPPVHSTSCGGDLPPCYILNRESGGDPRIWNGGCYAPVGYRGGSSPCGGSTASGLWQFLRSTWGGYGGYVNAADAPASVQNDRARQLWAGGRGCSHWSAC